MRRLIVLGSLLFSMPAHAFCWQGSGIDDALQYLVCLHNEQADSLNRQARALNDHADLIERLARDINDESDARERLDDSLEIYARKIVGVEAKAAGNSDDIEDLQARVAKLEMLLRQRGILVPEDKGFFWGGSR